MTCKEAEQMVMPYINKELTDKELSAFLSHIRICRDCYEELETYYTVAVTLHFLEKNEEGNYNIPLRLKEHLAQERQRLRNRKILRRCIGVFLVLWLAGLVWFLISVQLPDIYAFLPFGV